jgi:hypothetical protein
MTRIFPSVHNRFLRALEALGAAEKEIVVSDMELQQKGGKDASLE